MNPPWHPRHATQVDTGAAQVEGDGRGWALRRALAEGQDVAGAVRAHARPGAGIHELVDGMEEVAALVRGVGPQLAPLLAHRDVSDVLVTPQGVWVDRGEGVEGAGVDLGGEPGVRALAVHMAAACGRRLDDASPVVDGTLPGGVRLHAVLPPLSRDGTVISLRTSRAVAFSLEDLLGAGTVPEELGWLLPALVSSRANTLVSGATGSGKTTLLCTVLGLVPATERIICIEEVTELRPSHPHVVHLQERRPNVQGVGGVTLADLVRAAMRMRPDRLVLGECRGAEVRDVLTALNTGHDGGWATIHANTAQDVPARLAALGALAGMGESAVAAQAVAALDAVVQMRRDARGRRICQVGVLRRRGHDLVCEVALDVGAAGGVERGPAWGELRSRLGGEAP
ncbi:TadA family conjugal transfer-associated ATPase [Actinomyces polynesiensis]|uniref:TadA family conjugal transfer-associated ATPase n=1 Tax=Actinomyces polynesiensis TaxID=1325934 RepID=UPI000AF7EC90